MKRPQQIARVTLPAIALALAVTSRPAAAERLWTDGSLETGVTEETPVTFGVFKLLARRAAPAVVSIETENPAVVHPLMPFFGMDPDRGSPMQTGAGSGFVIREDGYILTNNHVVENARIIKVHLLDDSVYVAEILGRDPATDLALLKIDPKGKKLPVAPLGDSEAVEIGEWVVAIGNPMGLSHTVTAGIVSAKGRREVRPDGRIRYADFIQTDASINPGNSGGPLFNVRGQVIGINTAISAHAQGIGFAIPIDMVKAILPALAEDGAVTRSWLGVEIQEINAELARSFDLDQPHGALVSRVVPGGPAADAGLTSGDIITEFDGKPIERHDDLPWLASNAGVGRIVDLVVHRRGRKVPFRIKMAAMPGMNDAPRGDRAGEPRRRPKVQSPLGLTVEDLDRRGRRQLGVEAGAAVANVDAGSPAARAGLRRGDVVVQVNGEAVGGARDLVDRLDGAKEGSIVRLLVQRGEHRVFIALTR